MCFDSWANLRPNWAYLESPEFEAYVGGYHTLAASLLSEVVKAAMSEGVVNRSEVDSEKSQ